jgi:hypothetical protein
MAEEELDSRTELPGLNYSFSSWTQSEMDVKAHCCVEYGYSSVACSKMKAEVFGLMRVEQSSTTEG